MREHQGLPYRHRAGVSPYTSSYELAETCVFNKQSLPPIMCQGLDWNQDLTPYPEVTGPFCRVPSTGLSQGLSVLHPSTCGGLRYGIFD